MDIAKGWITRELEGIGDMRASALRDEVETLPDDHIAFYLLDGLDLVRMDASLMSASLQAAAKLAVGPDVSPADAEVMLSDLYDRLTSEPLLDMGRSAGSIEHRGHSFGAPAQLHVAG
jgi:hypothetical protein